MKTVPYALKYLKQQFEVQLGEVDMLMLDQIIQYAYNYPETVLLASSNSGVSKAVPKIVSCHISRAHEEMRAGSEVTISPGDDAREYFVKKEKGNDAKRDFGSVVIDGKVIPAYEIIEGPSHGVWQNYKYIPSPGFVGNDRIVFRVTGNSGREVVVTHLINVVKGAWTTNKFNFSGYLKYCPNGMGLREVSVGSDSRVLAGIAANSYVFTAYGAFRSLDQPLRGVVIRLAED